MRSDDIRGFVVFPHRWVVERTFSWFNEAGVRPRTSVRKSDIEGTFAVTRGNGAVAPLTAIQPQSWKR
jgi:hypothetical protein